MDNDFAKEFRIENDSLDTKQVIVMMDQDDNAMPVIKFYFSPVGFGISNFMIGGFKDSEEMTAEHKSERMFNAITHEQVKEAVANVIKKITDNTE